MYTVEIKHLNLEQIAESGQCFRWKKTAEGTYDIPAFGKVLTVSETEKGHFTLSCDEKEWEDIWKSYFDMDTDYDRIGRLIEESDDEYLKAAYIYGEGIRILRQDTWEMVITFLISQNNNIPRIRNSVSALCSLTDDGHFPGPGEVDTAVFYEKGMGLGYRSEYLEKMYIYGAEHPEFISELEKMDFQTAFEFLKGFKGIGAKVANCICLFGLHHVDAFPIDTHIKQILSENYQDGFDFERYEGVAGIVQQYMFYYDLKKTSVKNHNQTNARK
jgi:N-glycosylase/DNA lyase